MLTIPNYHLVEHLYSGVSQVYRARRASDDQAVVLKVWANAPAQPERIAGVQREYNLTRSLHLEGVVQGYSLEISREHLVMVLEDCGGEALTRLVLAGTLSLIDFLNLALRITAALEQLHRRRVIHKNINPANILFNPTTGQVRLIDFGSATELAQELPLPVSADLLPGTLPYISPEQTGRTGQVLDYRTDLYALGVTLYELLTGTLPFDSQDAEELIRDHISRQPVAPHAHKPGIPPILSAIILKLLEKEADARYGSAAGLQADLEECLHQLETRSYIEPFVPGARAAAEPPPAEAAAPPAQAMHRLDAEIARRQQAERALHAGQALFQSFIDHAPAAIFAKDRQGRYILANEQAGAPLHRTGADLIGKTAADLFPPEVVADAQRYEQQVIATGQPVACEQLVPFPDGMHTYLVTRFPIYNDQGELDGIGAIAADITLRKQTEAALHASESRLKAMFDNAATGIVLVDLDGYVIEANQTWLNLLDCTPADMAGITLPDIIAATDRAAQQEVWQALLRGEVAQYRREVRFLRLNGHVFWGDLSVTSIRNDQDAPEALLCVVADITERKQVEETLQLAQFSLDNTADEVLWIGQDKRFLYVNHAACQVLGYTREELLTMTIADINPVFPMEIWDEHWQNLRRQGFAKLETRHRRKDGTVFPVEVTSTHMERNDKEYICSFIRDITERKQAEETLRKWADIFQNIRMGVVVSDMGSTTLDMMNPAFADMYGYTVDELTGQPIADIYAPEARNVYEHSAQLVKEQDHVVFEALHRRKDGSTFPVLVDVTAIRSGPDQVPYRIANIQDLTERKHAETQLLEQHKALTMLRERERLARELHDNLGQVLGYIKTQAQATRELLDRGEVATADTYLAQMIAASQENHTDIREFILGATARATLDQGFFASLEHYLQRFEQLYGIEVGLQVAPDLNDHVFAPATDVQLLRIIQEALTNSRKHAQSCRVQVSFTSTADQVCIQVADNGRGFDPQQLAAPAENGQHYGLRSMRERAAEIGGHLRVEARPGAGTQVIVQLPRRVRQKRISSPLRVLLVDDHPLFLQGMQNLLTGRGVDVVGTACDGVAALARARELHPDIILMDVEMPTCNGLEATRLIKAELPDIQIVMLTMSEDDAHLFEAIKCGAAGYLLKGLDADAFFQLLTDVMEGEMVISPGLASRVLAEFAHHERSDTPPPVAAPRPDPTPRPDPAPLPDEPPPPSDCAMPPVDLTERQIEVLSLVAQGYTYQEIGDQLHLSKHTVRYHMREIISQLHLKNRAEIIAFAQHIGLR
jgi:PAS domain S-box-containing protein